MPNGNSLISGGGVIQPNFPVQNLNDDSLYFLFSADIFRQPARALI